LKSLTFCAPFIYSCLQSRNLVNVALCLQGCVNCNIQLCLRTRLKAPCRQLTTLRTTRRHIPEEDTLQIICYYNG
jgi:hypothetical protein